MSPARFAAAIAAFALAHPDREISSVTLIEFAIWRSGRAGKW